MTITAQQAASELLARRRARESFVEYCRYIAHCEGYGEEPALHHEYLCAVLQDVAEGKIQNAIVMMPPGAAKSTYATIRFPAWYLGRFGRRGIVSGSYNSDLAGSFGRKVRNLVNSPMHRAVFPKCVLMADSKAKGEWETEEGGFYFACGVDEGVNGRRGDLFVGDDIIKGRKDADSPAIRNKTWEWYTSDIRTRLKPKHAGRILVGTRWHEDDPIGRILPENYAGESGWIEGRDGAKWFVVCIPAEAKHNDPIGRKPGDMLWPEWFSAEYWEAEKKAQSLVPRNWLSLYQQTPTAEEGTYFRREWFESRYTDVPDNLAVYMSGDFAVTADGGDFTELAVWGVDSLDNIYALDWWSGQTSSDVWINEMLIRFKRFGPIFFIGETGPIRRAVEPQLKEAMRRTRTYCALEWLSSGGNKEASAQSFQGLCAQGRVRFPKGQTWAERVIDQLLRFPAGKHDDAVDTCGLFGRFIHRVWSNTEPKPQPQLEDVWQTQLKVADFRSPKKAATW